MREKVEQLFCRLWRTLTSYFWPQIDQFNTKIAKTGVFGVEWSSSWIDNSAILLYKPIPRKTRWVLILLFALVALEMELVPKGYYIDANVSTGRRLLRVVFTLKSLCTHWKSFIYSFSRQFRVIIFYPLSRLLGLCCVVAQAGRRGIFLAENQLYDI